MNLEILLKLKTVIQLLKLLNHQNITKKEILLKNLSTEKMEP